MRRARANSRWRYAIAIACLFVASLPLLGLGHLVLVRKAEHAAGNNNLSALRWIVTVDPFVVNARTDIDELDNYPLIYNAIGNSNDAMVAFLIRRGANLDWRDWMGKTALYHAVEEGDASVAKIILEAGADPNIADSGGTRPLSVAARQRNAEMTALLKKHGARK